jgi:branched-chain amino acid transport system permease protein
MEKRMAEWEDDHQPDRDVHVRANFDRMARAYLKSILSEQLIEEYRGCDGVHFSEPLARLLAWCQRRPLSEQYAVKAEADSTFRLITFAGRRGQAPRYVDEKRYATLQEARYGAFLCHIRDLAEK